MKIWWLIIQIPPFSRKWPILPGKYMQVLSISHTMADYFAIINSLNNTIQCSPLRSCQSYLFWHVYSVTYTMNVSWPFLALYFKSTCILIDITKIDEIHKCHIQFMTLFDLKLLIIPLVSRRFSWLQHRRIHAYR